MYQNQSFDRHLCALVLQAVFRSAQAKNEAITEALQADAAEAVKLLQRQSAAEAQYDQGLQKLQATSRQLRSLSSKVGRAIMHRAIEVHPRM